MALTFESRFVFLLLYILSLHAIAIFFFTTGFLLTRNELPLYSRCDDAFEGVCCDMSRHNESASISSSSEWSSADSAALHCSDESNYRSPMLQSLPTSSCWTSPAVRKVVILVFDAMRFDFVAPTSGCKEPRPWMNKLQVMHKLSVEESSRAKLFKFIADPPTTSLQRLKGLTTGSLPTFIDVGSSFGAPAIVEDNIIHQLMSNGKKVIMMGDDTWVDLFPSQFTQTFPFPSFNVKDLHTVDDGVIENLFPALREGNWDLLIGHFLGVDHVGHIFGVDSPHMVKKLEQYNEVVEDVISLLRDHSHLGGLHNDTLLLVMGDHGQTLNGDHGGGTAEEVETALFAWSSREPTYLNLAACHSLGIITLAEDNQTCTFEFQQLDFAATLAAILGVPFPFGSIGKVNGQLYGLVARTWTPSKYETAKDHEDDWLSLNWLKVYSNVLCLNSWQVNRYFDEYSESLLNGFSQNDIMMLQNLYDDAQFTSRESSFLSGDPLNLNESLTLFANTVEKYNKYLDAAASLARSKWTQFRDDLMLLGLVTLLIALVIQALAVYDLGRLDYGSSPRYEEVSGIVVPVEKMIKSGLVFGVFSATASAIISVIASLLSGGSICFSSRQYAIIIVGGAIIGTTHSYLFKRCSPVADKAIMAKLNNCWQIGCAHPDPIGALAICFCCLHAVSLLSNSFILREHQVVTFLLVSIGILELRVATQQGSKIPQALCFLVMNCMLSYLCEINLFKDTQTQTKGHATKLAPSQLPSAIWQLLFLCVTTYIPLAIVGCFFTRKIWRSCLLLRNCSWVIFFGVSLSYTAVCVHWLLDDLVNLQLLVVPASIQELTKFQLPRAVYCVVAFQSLSLFCSFNDPCSDRYTIELKKHFEEKSVPFLGVWIALILLLLGRQGPIIALIAGIEGWCILNKQSLYAQSHTSQIKDNISSKYTAATVQWSLFAVQIFFCTGHSCAFDGLHYAAAFIGFDQFNIYRQGVLLALDTFGASHLLPAAGLALLVAKRTPPNITNSATGFYKLQLSQAFLLYGLMHTLTATCTTLCVTIQRRHLMVWGLFAPKFVFDAIGLLVTDVALLVTYFYYAFPF